MSTPAAPPVRRPIGVGVVGANPDAGWARYTHLPVIQASPAFALAAVSSRRQASADAAARAFGAAHAFDDAGALVAAPGVDLVVVSVKTPDHAAVVRLALEAGKAVFCEWPLAADLAQAEALAGLAAERGAFTVVGLQNRVVPAAAAARALVREGRIGTPVSATLVGSMAEMGARRPQSLAYSVERRSGANAVTIAGGHLLDLLGFVAGPVTAVEGRLATRFPRVTITDGAGTAGEVLDADAPDEVAVAGEFGTHGTFVAHVRGGAPAGTRLLLEVQGTDGALRLTSASLPSFAGATLELAPDGANAFTAVDVPDAPAGAPGPADAVGRVYARIAAAWPGGAPARGTGDAAGGQRGDGGLATFADALSLHRVLDAIERASESGRRQRVGRGSGGALAGDRFEPAA